MFLVFTTYPDKKSAEGSAKNFVQKKLAACVNIIKLEQSFYPWGGKVAQGKEYLLMIKTSSRAYPHLEKEIKKSHPYDLPELIAIKVAKGNAKYLGWVNQSCLGF